MAKRNLVMALSLAAMVAVGLGSTTGLLEGVGGRVESQPTTDLAAEGRESGQVNMKQNCTSSEAVARITSTESCCSSLRGVSHSSIDPGVNR